MAGGRPKKKARNITGLRHQAPAAPQTVSPSATSTLDSVAPGLTRESSPYQTESGWQSDDDETIAVLCDGLKISFEQEYFDCSSTDESDIDEEVELDVLNDEGFGRRLVEMVEKEDGKDPDWIPERLQRKMRQRAAQRKREQ